MALSGSFSTSKYSTSSHGTIGLNLSWTGTQNVANNTTTIKWTLKSNGSMSSGYYVQGGPITVTINGTKVFNPSGRFTVRGGGGYKHSGSTVVKHNEDGSKSVTMSVKAALYSSSVNCTGSASYTLNKINRYALISTADPFGDEDNPSVAFTNPAGTTLVTNLKLGMTWKDTNNVEHATEFVDIPSEQWAGGIVTLNLDDYRADLLASCPNSVSLPVTFVLQSTMGGTVYSHTKASTMMVYNASPIANTVSYREMDDDVFDITGNRSSRGVSRPLN